MNPKMSFRFAQPEDAPAFAAWAASNPQIERKDLEAATKEANPTATFLVIEQDGKPIMFMPVYLTMRIGYLGFNPAADKPTREAALEMMLRAVQALALEYKISSVDVLTRSGIPVAEWARDHGFNPDPRELFTLKLNSSPEKMVQ